MSGRAKRQVVVVGGGAAGYAAAAALVPALEARAHTRLVMLSDRPSCVIRPLLSEVATGWIAPQLCLSELSGLTREGPVDLFTERVRGIDFDGRRVHTERQEVPYDYLLLATGSEPALPPDWSGKGPWYALESDLDALRLNKALERLRAQGGPMPRVVIIGGGPTGVDLAASLAGGLSGGGAHGRDGDGRQRAFSVILVEREERLVSHLPHEVGQHAHDVLEGLGVQVHLSHSVSRVEPGGVVLDDGTRIECDLSVWAGGHRASRALAGVQPQRGESGGFPVDDYQRLVGHSDVFVAGAAATPTDPPPFPRDFAQTARLGALAGRNLLAAMCGRAPERVEHTVDLMGVGLGRHRGAALFRGVLLTGMPAWSLLRMSLLRAVPRMTQKIGILGTWAGELFSSLWSRP